MMAFGPAYFSGELFVQSVQKGAEGKRAKLCSGYVWRSSIVYLEKWARRRQRKRRCRCS